ncbi:MAG: DUF3078 domain-containing protein [Alistipes sp.]|nr:DUF3078 domain-containing protein [Alistipes sp.]
MKKIFTLFLVGAALLPVVANAQVTVEAAAPKEQVAFSNEVKTDEQKPAFSSEAQRKADRKAILKERNTIEFNASLNGSLSHFNTYWQKVNGTTNTITGVASILFTHQFKKDRFVLDNKITGKIGYTWNFFDDSKKQEVTKSQDEWFISTSPAYKLAKSWNVGGTVSLRSQFANGATRGSSQIFAPAYLIASVGFTYVCPKEKFPIKINIAPLSLNATFVTSEAVRAYYFAEKGFTDTGGNAVTYDQYIADKSILDRDQRNTPYAFGLTLENGSGRYEGGSSVQIDFDRTFGKKGIFRYRTTLYSFYGWINEAAQQTESRKTGIEYEHIAPTVRWENTVDIKATKYFSTQLYFQLYYNKAQSRKIQTQTVLGVGLSYTFKNK